MFYRMSVVPWRSPPPSFTGTTMLRASLASLGRWAVNLRKPGEDAGIEAPKCWVRPFYTLEKPRLQHVTTRSYSRFQSTETSPWFEWFGDVKKGPPANYIKALVRPPHILRWEIYPLAAKRTWVYYFFLVALPILLILFRVNSATSKRWIT